MRDDTRDQGSGSWGNWGEWSRWNEWAGRSGWPKAQDMGALRDFERLARDFVTDMRSVAWDSGTIFGSDVMPALRNILADTLDRIRTEVFDINHEDQAADQQPPGANGAAPQPAASQDTAPRDTAPQETAPQDTAPEADEPGQA